MVSNTIMVEMGEGAVGVAPGVILTSWIGSCLVATLYDTRWRIGALAHIMFPDIQYTREVGGPYRYANLALAAMIRELRHRGACNGDIVAKIAGGANMFPSYHGNAPGIGGRNVASMKRQLELHHIPLVGDDTGGGHGRSVAFHLDSGLVVIKAPDREDVEL